MCKSCPPCLWEKSWWCCCWVVCSLQCAGVLLVKVYDWQECVSRAKWAFTLSEQGGGMLCEKHVSDFSLWHYRTLCALCCHAPPTPPPTPPIWRSGKESWSCRGWRRRMSRARRRLRGVLVFFCFFLSAWTKFCHVVYKITCFPSACVLMWHGCTLQELAGRVRGQRLQQQHSVHSCLLRGAVCRGHLHNHRRALWTDHQQTLHDEGEVCSSDGVELHIHWHFNAAFQYPYFYTVWYAKNIFSLSNAVCRKYKNVSSHHSLHAFLPMLTHNPLRSCGYVTSP